MSVNGGASSDARGPERRRENHGAPGGGERRKPGDRRAENNLLHVRFEAAGTSFLTAASEIQEILAAPRALPVPLVRPEVAGLLNLRGQILAVVDLRRLLGQPDGTDEPLGVVIRAGAEPLVLLVDAVHDVLEVSPTMLRPPPANLSGAARALTRAVVALPDELLLVLAAAEVGRMVASEAGEAALA